MKIEISSLFVTLINIATLIGLIYIIIKTLRTLMNTVSLNSNIEKKLDKILKYIEDKDNQN